MISVYFCEENIELVERITDKVHKLDLETSVKIIPYAKNTIKQIEEMVSEIDVLVTDIKMETINGIDLAKSLREKGFKGAIIYFSDAKECVFDVFETRPTDFIFKNEEDKLIDRLKKVIIEKNVENNDYIILGNISKRNKVFKKNIEYVESYKRKMLVQEKDGTLNECYMKVDDMMSLLPEEVFSRVHKSFIINIDHIKNVDKTMVYMKSGAMIPMGRAHREDINRVIEYALESKKYKA